MKTEKKITIPEINKEFEKFDVERYHASASNEKEFIRLSDKLIVNDIQSYGYISVVFYNNSYFKLVKKFHKNGNIKARSLLFNNGYPIGVGYIFNENGLLEDEINYDEGYDFGWHAIINYCHHNNIVLEKGYPEKGGIKTEIYKREEAGSKLWIISYYDFQTQQYLEVTLDGKTGKEINRRKLEWIGN